MGQSKTLERYADSLTHKEPVTDEALLSAAANEIKELNGAPIKGTKFLTMGFLRGYYLNMQAEDDKTPKTLIAFVFPVLNRSVLEFLVRAAKNDSINGILGFTSNVCVVKEYKLKGGS